MIPDASAFVNGIRYHMILSFLGVVIVVYREIISHLAESRFMFLHFESFLRITLFARHISFRNSLVPRPEELFLVLIAHTANA